VIGASILACSLAVKRGRSNSSETARGGSSFVRKKKLDRCIDRREKGRTYYAINEYSLRSLGRVAKTLAEFC